LSHAKLQHFRRRRKPTEEIPSSLPWFAGVRSAELARLDWEEVNLKEGFIRDQSGQGQDGKPENRAGSAQP
jgi:hypothetical protein